MWEGQHQNTEVFGEARSGVPSLQKRTLYSFPIKEKSSRLATSFSFSKRTNGKEPPRVGPMLPPTRAPLMKTPTGSASPALSSRTLTHVDQASSLPVRAGTKTDTARRASGDATASSLISWTLFP